MRYLTPRDKKIAEAERALDEAHGARDFACYDAARAARENAYAMPAEYRCCGCGSVWDGSGRLTVGVLVVSEQIDGQEAAVVHRRHDPEPNGEGQVHLVFCPHCKPGILAGLNHPDHND